MSKLCLHQDIDPSHGIVKTSRLVMTSYLFCLQALHPAVGLNTLQQESCWIAFNKPTVTDSTSRESGVDCVAILWTFGSCEPTGWCCFHQLEINTGSALGANSPNNQPDILRYISQTQLNDFYQRGLYNSRNIVQIHPSTNPPTHTTTIKKNVNTFKWPFHDIQYNTQCYAI